jgi:formamidopyrimidine-DNA glycosylase
MRLPVEGSWCAAGIEPVPELPEIEHLKRSLEPMLIGAAVRSVTLRRRDVVRLSNTTSRRRRFCSADLLSGTAITGLQRHGKNLALIAENGRALCVHLGMSGQLRFAAHGQRLPQSDHVHCIWSVRSRAGDGRLIFRDPRRFGGLWPFPSFERLKHLHWSCLGPDALDIEPGVLTAALAKSHRPIKAALLDQSVLAGVGNIYADESLFHARIHPASIAARLSSDQIRRLTCAIRSVLNNAIEAGGSTIRSYLDGNGIGGRYAESHMVYGRGGSLCCRCGQRLVELTIAQRTTTFCRGCQSRV